MSLGILEDIERGFGPERLQPFRSGAAQRRRERWAARDAKEAAEKERIAKLVQEKEKTRATILKNFAIVKQATGKRQQYALYRLWRYLDIDKAVLVEFVRQNIPAFPFRDEKMLSDLFAGIFAEQCEKAKRCVLKPFMPKPDASSRRCLLEGCDRPVHWSSNAQGWRKFCSVEHSSEYIKAHPGIYLPQTVKRRQLRRRDRILHQIQSGEIQYQSQLIRGPNAGKVVSWICRLMEREGMITRERAFFDGRWTLRLKVATSKKK